MPTRSPFIPISLAGFCVAVNIALAITTQRTITDFGDRVGRVEVRTTKLEKRADETDSRFHAIDDKLDHLVELAERVDRRLSAVKQ